MNMILEYFRLHFYLCLLCLLLLVNRGLADYQYFHEAKNLYQVSPVVRQFSALILSTTTAIDVHDKRDRRLYVLFAARRRRTYYLFTLFISPKNHWHAPRIEPETKPCNRWLTVPPPCISTGYSY